MNQLTKLVMLLLIPMPVLGAVSNPPPPFIIQEEGSNLAKRNKLNFIGSSVTCVDNGGTFVTDCTLTGGSGYATVQEEGSGLTQRATINFVGNGLTCVDNAGATKTDCTLTDAGGAAAGVVTTGTQTIAGSKTFSSSLTMSGTNGITLGASTTGFLANATTLTPDGPNFYTGTTSNSFHIREFGDAAFDHNNGNCGTSTCTDPTLIIQSHNQTANQYLDFSHNATNGVVNVGIGGLDLPAHTGAHGTAPAVSACGTSPGTVTGNDTYGKVVTGSGGTVQSCTLTFAVAYVVAPSCICNDETSILLVRATSTTTTLVCDSAVAGTLASQTINYICKGL